MNALAITDDANPSIYTGVSNNGVWVAVDDYIKSLKANGIYTKLKAVYLMIGGSASTHKYNLKNVADTDAAFRIMWFGSGIHSQNGFQGNGANSYGNTFFKPNENLTTNNESFGFYSRTNIDDNSVDLGSYDSSGQPNSFIFPRRDDKIQTRLQTDNYNETPTNLVSTGFFAASRIIAASYSIFYNNINSTINETSIGRAPANYHIGNMLDIFFSNRECPYYFIGQGLTITEMNIHKTTVIELQTALNRQV